MNELRCSALAFVLFLSNNIFSQGTLSGKIKDENGVALPFVQVSIKNTYLSAMTNNDGLFEFKKH